MYKALFVGGVGCGLDLAMLSRSECDEADEYIGVGTRMVVSVAANAPRTIRNADGLDCLLRAPTRTWTTLTWIAKEKER
jgi:hypothetical protein